MTHSLRVNGKAHQVEAPDDMPLLWVLRDLLGLTCTKNFHDYRVVPMSDMPRVEVVIVPSTDPPGGVGEPGLPPLAPAVCNALLVLTGTPIRRLPIRLA